MVTAMRYPLSVSALEALMGEHISPGVLRYAVNRLVSVLYEDKMLNGAIRIARPSFTGYIIDWSRSHDLCVDLEVQNTVLARRCFITMTHGLRFNICDLESSDVFNRDLPGLKARVQTAITLHLRYSVRSEHPDPN